MKALKGTAGTPRTASDPPVFRLIEMTAAAARSTGISVAVCGELAGIRQATEAPIGLGINALCTAPEALAAVRTHVCDASVASAQRAAVCQR